MEMGKNFTPSGRNFKYNVFVHHIKVRYNLQSSNYQIQKDIEVCKFLARSQHLNQKLQIDFKIGETEKMQ